MREIKEHDLKRFRLRAKLPQYIRYAAVSVLVIAIMVVIVGFYRGRNYTPFKLLPGHTQLSTDVVADVNGYERLESVDGVSKYYIKADNAKTYSDNHQELENVFLKTFDETGAEADTLTAQKALYVPESDHGFTAYMVGDVNINSRDEMKVTTNNIVYSKAKETADADEEVAFELADIRGRSFGASFDLRAKRLQLLKDVQIETGKAVDQTSSNVRLANASANSATLDQNANEISLNGNVKFKVESGDPSGSPETTNATAGRALISYSKGSGNNGFKGTSLQKFELFDDVHIVRSTQQGDNSTIDAGHTLYDNTSGRYQLDNGVQIKMTSDAKTTNFSSSKAVYDPNGSKVSLTGTAQVAQGTDVVSGDQIDADLYPGRSIKNVTVKGNSNIRRMSPDRTISVSAPVINSAFDSSGLMQTANTVGNSVAILQPSEPGQYSLVTLSAPNAIRLFFKGEGSIDRMQTDGRTTIQLESGNKDGNSANKRVTADTVSTFFNENGKDLKRAEAVGNAELYIEPIQAAPDHYRTTVYAPRFDCDFYPGNNARTCVGGRKGKTIRIPTVPSNDRGTQTILAEQFTANFGERSNDVEKLDAVGNVKFTERDRNAVAAEITYTQSDSMFRLRGNEPTAWDRRSRGRAREIDWDSRNNKSYFRGGVSTTYYSQNKNNNSTPFGSSEKPVFITSETAEFDHSAETSTFTGNARGWQENNYIRGDRFFIKQAEGRFFADGGVQSLLYDTKKKERGKEANVPVYASAASFAYDRDKRLLHYESNVDIRQGTDRISSGKADIYLDEKNDMSRTVAESSVVMTQPGRRATGDRVEYTAGDELAVLRGSPATVNDSENGTSQAAELSFYMKENRIVSVGRSKPNSSGRIRSVYKLKP